MPSTLDSSDPLPSTPAPDESAEREASQEKIYALRRDIAASGTGRWIVSIARRGRAFMKCFSDKRYGSEAHAKAAAIAYRDEIIQEYPLVSKRELHVIQRRNRADGSIPGVSLLTKGKNKNQFWRALISYPDKRTASKSFSVAEYGAEQAYALALEARQQMLDAVAKNEPFKFHHVHGTLPVRVSEVTALAVPASRPPPKQSRNLSRNPVQGVYRVEYGTKGSSEDSAPRVAWRTEGRWADGSKRVKTFSVNLLGEERARTMALQERQAWDQEPPPPRPPADEYPCRPISAVSNVVRKKKKLRGNDLEQGRQPAIWMVSYRWPDGHAISRSFSVLMYGEEGARKMAEKVREQWLKQAPTEDERKQPPPLKNDPLPQL